jgi:hypothetical protein
MRLLKVKAPRLLIKSLPSGRDFVYDVEQDYYRVLGGQALWVSDIRADGGDGTELNQTEELGGGSGVPFRRNLRFRAVDNSAGEY